MFHPRAYLRAARRGARLKLLLLVFVAVCLGLMAYAKSARRASGPFALADELPRGALVYAQFKDLPALVKQWNKSALKEQYLKSTNFEQLGKSHLWLKLSERWTEFNDALGFTLDAEALTGATDNSAAIAIYDIGRLDLVFIAPLSEEKLAATKFYESQDQFEETELPDGTSYYSLEVEADRGRQKQQLCFASVRDRFVLATSERLLLRALANINGKAQKDRLSDDTGFKSLSEKATPHFVSVWVDQSKLNTDWYFKHYWLMQNTEQLKNIRACLFDLDVQDGRWTERRDLLYANGSKRAQGSGIPGPEAKRLAAMIPRGVPYFKLRAFDAGAGESSPASLIREALLDRSGRERAGAEENWDWQHYGDSDFEVAQAEDWYGERGRYSSLDDDYDARIDDPRDAGLLEREEPRDNPLLEEKERSVAENLEGTLAAAQPVWAANLTSPQTMKGPLFVEFRRAAILTLRSPGNLNREELESALSAAVAARLLTAGARSGFNWTSEGEKGAGWRQLQLPMLGWELCYALRGRELVVSNSIGLLKSILVSEAQQGLATGEMKMPDGAAKIDDLTVINLDQRKQAFDDVFARLDAEAIKEYWKQRAPDAAERAHGASQEFFSGNIGSLLGAASSVGRIEIKRNSLPDRLHEEIDYVLK